MKSTQVLRLLTLAGLGSVVATASFAQEDSYIYGGLSIGQSRAKIDENRITASLLASGLTTTSMSRDESSVAYKLFGGYQLNRNFAIEGGYFDLGKFGFTSTTTPAGTLNGRIKLRGLNVDLVGTLPLTDRFFAIARVGGQFARASDNFSGTGAVSVLNPNPSKSELNYKAGLGLQYEFSRSFLMRAEAERYRVNDAVGNHGDINLYSVSLVFPFGRAPAPAPRAMAAPAYVAPAHAPEPPTPMVIAAAPLAPAPIAPERRRVSFSADSLFTFDKAVIRPEGKEALDKFAKDLSGTQFEMIAVEGFTDRIGTEAYNLALSARRATAVKAYLVASGGIDAAKITAVGRGESNPVTKADDCRGSKANAKLIACLQPDRRVDVEVSGTR